MFRRSLLPVIVASLVGLALSGCFSSTQNLDAGGEEEPLLAEEVSETSETRKEGETNGNHSDPKANLNDTPLPQVELTVQAQELYAVSGGSATFWFLVENTGAEKSAVDFNVQVSEPWSAQARNESASIRPNETANVTVEVFAPDGDPGESTTIRIQAINEGHILAEQNVTAILDDVYVQDIMFNWFTTELDVLILGVQDPLIGAAIKDAIESWKKGIHQLAPAIWQDENLLDELRIRVHWAAEDGIPPTGFSPNIYFVPHGAHAIHTNIGPDDNSCIATAPSGQPHSFYHLATHEFGHCLGLGHAFEDGVEYRPRYDIMGGGELGYRSCPSNMNLMMLEQVFTTDNDSPIEVAQSTYYQADC